MPINNIAQAQAMSLDALASAVNNAVALRKGATPSPNLQQVFNDMRAQGYQLGQPRRFRTSTVAGHAEWHINFTIDHVSFVMAFFIPEEV